MINYRYTQLIALLLVFMTGIDAQTYIGAGNTDGLTVTSSDNANNTTAENTINGSGLDAPKMEAARFLAHATMGHDRAEVDRTSLIDAEQWIDEQKDIPVSYLTPLMEDMWDSIYTWQFAFYENMFFETFPDSSLNDQVLLDIDDEIFGPYSVQFHYAWWQNTILSPDQLRQKMAYALSQIFVVSKNSDLGDQAHALTVYYDLLLKNAFGNYRDLISDVTYSISMGLYLSHYNNPKEIPEENLHPDENYAREIMQLFSIGLYELNQDGTRKKDANGNDIPTYNNADIKELAKVFTGLGPTDVNPNPWVDDPYFGLDFGLADKTQPMLMYEEWHQQGEKLILGELLIPDGQSGLEDIEMTLDFLFNHPNVGPFISRQLIQRLVKSNPSPQYIERVARVFADNGSGVRGDLFATAKAILMDEEARSCEALQDIDNGHLIEPR